MESLKFEDLPKTVAEILRGQNELMALLRLKDETVSETDNPLSIDEVIKLTGYTKHTIYGYCQKKSIPHHKKNGRLFFFKSEIVDWIKTGKQKTRKEVEVEAENYLSNHKKGLNNG